MMHLSHPRSVFILRRNTVELYKEDSASPLRLEIPSSVIENQEIVDHDSLEKLLGEFLAPHALKQSEAIFILDSEMSYQKVLPVTDEENDIYEVKKIIDEIPFDAPNIAKTIIKRMDEIIVFAANKNLFFPIVRMLKKHGIQVRAVVPVTVTGIADQGNQSIPASEVVRVMKNVKHFDHVNFLTSPEEIKIVTQKERQKPPAQFLIVAGVVVVTAIATVFGAQFFFSKTSQAVKKSAVKPKAQKLSQKPSPTLTKAEATYDKSTARVKVYNGSGTPGEANEIRDMLVGLGFTEVDTDNAATHQTVTSVVVIHAVPQTMRNEIVSKLKASFENVELKEEATAEADIVITSGT